MVTESRTLAEAGTASSRSPRRSEDLARIAFSQFSELGFEKVSLDRVAEEAGVTKGSLYSHFSSKGELFAAASQVYYRQWQEKVQKLLAANHDARAGLHRLLDFSVRRCVVDRKNRLFTTELFALSLREPLVRSGWAQFYSTVREQYVALVLAAQESGQLRSGNARRRVDLMLCALEGIKLRATYEPEIGDGQEIQVIVGELMEILGADGAK